MNNFILFEFACKDKCGKCDMDKGFLKRIDLARDYSNIPYIINSGCRCEAHNLAVGSTSLNHIEGKAADIKFTSNWTLMRIVTGLVLAGFRRIGINRKYKFVHVDNRDKPESLWGY